MKFLRIWVKILHPNPTQQSPKSLPCLHGGQSILQSGKFQSITYTPRAVCRALTSQMQMLQPHMLPPNVHQFSWWELYEIQWMMQPTFKCQCQKSNSQGSRCFIFTTPWLVSLCHTHHRPIPNWGMDDVSSSFDEHFPTVLLNDNVWAEEQILDWCLCIHKRPDEPNHQCSYPCPYNSNTTFLIDLLQWTLQNEAVFNYDPMNFSDISSDLPDIMMTTSDTNIPDLDDVSDTVWFT